MSAGIYVIHNTKTGQIYIGQTQNLLRRWRDHRYMLNSWCHENQYLQKAWREYGEKSFTFKVLEHCPIDQLIEREQHYLNIYMPKGICYNVHKKSSRNGR